MISQVHSTASFVQVEECFQCPVLILIDVCQYDDQSCDNESQGCH